MPRLILALSCLSFLLPAAAQGQVPDAAGQMPAAAAARLAYFSPQRAFALSADGKAAQAKLAALDAERSKEITSRNSRLKGMQDALLQSSSVLGEVARRQREIEVERFQVDIKRFVEDAQAEFLGVQRDLENAFFDKLRPALDAVAKDKGLLLVFNADTGVFAWTDPSLDITADVVRRVNQP